ncbi:uncharacterized protein LOC135375810 isoform X1 [Ornithodoros turicata]|uniref:uncharacterized protein LOC135375810 isoform X1 n=2 Tax=Ornithodoros turicata TaxID=34597 RepID=UPI003139270F
MAKCFKVPETYYMIYTNTKHPSILPCTHNRQLCVGKNGETPYELRSLKDGKLVRRVVTFRAEKSPCYNVPNIQRAPKNDGAQLPAYDFMIAYADCGNCVVAKLPTISPDACAMFVTNPDVPPSRCCLFTYAIFCGSTKIPSYEKDKCANL